jgi:hypothetical protein
VPGLHDKSDYQWEWPMLIVPLNIVVTPFSERGQTEPSTWTGTDPGDALGVANNIWMPANIQFHLKTSRRFRHAAGSTKRLAHPRSAGAGRAF